VRIDRNLYFWTIDKSEPFSDFGIAAGLEFTYYFSESFSAETAVLWGVYAWAFESRNVKGVTVGISCSLIFVEVPIVTSYRIPLGPGAVTAGLGYDITLGPGILSFDTQDVRTLTTLFTKNGAGELFPGDFDEFYIHTVTVYLSYGFPVWGQVAPAHRVVIRWQRTACGTRRGSLRHRVYLRNAARTGC